MVKAPIIVKTLLKQPNCVPSAYIVMHSGLSKTPLWSAEYITNKQLMSNFLVKTALEDDRLSKHERANSKIMQKAVMIEDI